MRIAISPRLAIQDFANGVASSTRRSWRATENCIAAGCARSASRKSPAPQLERCGVARIDHAIVEHARGCGEYVDLASNTPMICAFIWSSFSLSTGLPRLTAAASVTIHVSRLFAAITAVLALP